ncbi:MULTISPECIES: HEAT repeat domain-containing protein [Kribbella]|uniref:MerR family transcriptional regulator n=1 Tax=Kribbella karoonensis TaxID=324851 RepID=A0ABN2DN59_9ACTN
MLIGEVARRSGVSSRMLRHYESLGLVRPTGRTVGGYREYADDDIRRIFHVEALRSLGLSLREIGRALEDPGFAAPALLGDLIRRTEERLHREQELLDRLRAIDAATPDDWPDVLRVVELLHSLNSPSAARRQQAVLAPTDDELPTEILAAALLTESDPNVAGALRWALARSTDDVLAALTPALRSADVTIRRRAVVAIAEISTADAVPVLTAALKDPDLAVRKHAALSLGARGERSAVPALVALIIEGANDVDAAEALGTLAADPGTATHILTTLTHKLPRSSPEARLRLVQALGELPPSVTHDTLVSLTHDEQTPVALTAKALLRAFEKMS